MDNDAFIEREVATALLRVYQADWGPTGSDPKLKTEITTKDIQEQMDERGITLELATVSRIVGDFAAQDYVTLARSADGGAGQPILKVYPARLKRRYNLWDIEE